jgi:hypothetical protein
MNLENSIHYNGELHLTLRELIDMKSKRDGISFTVYQLAKAINMPHSILVKLIHPDPAKRVNNPRIDTLAKIVDFFKSDGFLVTIDDLLLGHKEIDIPSQSINQKYIEKSIQTFSLDYEQKVIGVIDIKLPEEFHNNFIAFLSEEEISPFFKKGSIFIVDKNIKPENDNLIAIKMEKYRKILIKKLVIDGSKKYLFSINNRDEKILLLPTDQYLIIGVIVQVNAKT